MHCFIDANTFIYKIDIIVMHLFLDTQFNWYGAADTLFHAATTIDIPATNAQFRYPILKKASLSQKTKALKP
jgi:hypothetical protein